LSLIHGGIVEVGLLWEIPCKDDSHRLRCRADRATCVVDWATWDCKKNIRHIGHISRRGGHMEPTQDEKAMGANIVANLEGQARSTHDDAAIQEALDARDYRRAVAHCARMHGAAIGRLCMALVGSQAEAQELAQETLVAAYQAFPSYRAEGTVRAFLFGIARRLCARHVETRARRGSILRLVHDATSVQGDAAEWLTIRQRAEQVRTALEGLRPTERDAVVLRFQGGLSFREVGQSCGVDEATARKRVSRAIARLRVSLGDF